MTYSKIDLNKEIQDGIAEYHHVIEEDASITERLKELSKGIASRFLFLQTFSSKEIEKSHLLKSLSWTLEYGDHGDRVSAINGTREDLQNAIRAKHRKFELMADGFSFAEAGILCHQKDVDPEAFRIVFKILNRIIGEHASRGHHLDSAGHWGLSPNFIKEAWLAQGARDGGKFRMYISEMARELKNTGNVGYIHYSVMPKKGESIEFYRDFLKGFRFINKSELEVNWFSRKAVRAIGRLSRIARIASIKGFQYYSDIPDESGEGRINKMRIRHLNWEAVKYWTAQSKKEQSKLLKPVEAWYTLFKRCPQGISDDSMVHPSGLDKVMLKSFRALMANKPENEPFEAFTEPALRLSFFFRDSQSIERFIKKGEFDSIHDAGQFIIPKRIDFDFWKRMVLRTPEFMSFSGLFYSIEKLVKNGDVERLPESLTEIREVSALCSYAEIESVDVATVAASYNLSEDEAKKYDRFFSVNAEKTFESLPHVKFSDGEYTFEKMDAFDIEGPFLGLATGCCQHLHSAGSSCAKAGYRDGESGFYVVRKNNTREIVAMSWAWRSVKGHLVFDSIEARSSTSVPLVANIYKVAAEMMIGKLGVQKIYVGDTSYGLTSQVKSFLKVTNVKKGPTMVAQVSYSDAKNVWQLI